MFTKKSDGGAGNHRGAGWPSGGPPQLPHAQPAKSRRAGGGASIIGAELTITGSLESTGEVQIDGEVQGDIRAGRIVVGEQATITGTLIANEIVIGGNVQGSIHGNSVTFQAASRIEGEVYHRSLAIEQGAYFEGKSRRSDDPTSVPTTSDVLPAQ